MKERLQQVWTWKNAKKCQTGEPGVLWFDKGELRDFSCLAGAQGVGVEQGVSVVLEPLSLPCYKRKIYQNAGHTFIQIRNALSVNVKFPSNK